MPDLEREAGLERARVGERLARRARGLRTYEGAPPFAADDRCTYGDYPYKREWGGRMTKGPRLSRPWARAASRGPGAAVSESVIE